MTCDAVVAKNLLFSIIFSINKVKKNKYSTYIDRYTGIIILHHVHDAS